MSQPAWLYAAASVSIVRHIKICSAANPVIRGWAMYHRHVVAAKRFAWIDHQIWQVLWRWAVRRHAMKSAHWVKQRYFRVVGQRHWVFATQEKARGMSQPAWLYAAASVS
ncbi:group II intron maturase-specific domain-containing protein, partial [Acinetobacter baumannii]|uniref:group II intron maturase-specific domain-containing protein n=1 Tax=Acinetobacter baumannii TaxID=470 RepID=UPI002AE09A0B